MSFHVHNRIISFNIRIEKFDFVSCSFLDIFSKCWFLRTSSNWWWDELLHLNCSDCSDNYVCNFRSLCSWKCEALREIDERCNVWATLIAEFWKSRHIWRICKRDDFWISREDVARLRCKRNRWQKRWYLWFLSEMISSMQNLICKIQLRKLVRKSQSESDKLKIW